MESNYILKSAFGGIVSLEVGSIVGSLAGLLLPKNLKPAAKLGVSVATTLLGSIVTDKLCTVIDSEIDSEAAVIEEQPEGA